VQTVVQVVAILLPFFRIISLRIDELLDLVGLCLTDNRTLYLVLSLVLTDIATSAFHQNNLLLPLPLLLLLPLLLILLLVHL